MLNWDVEKYKKAMRKEARDEVREEIQDEIREEIHDEVREERDLEIVKKLIQRGDSIEGIADLFELTVEGVEKLKSGVLTEKLEADISSV